MVNKILLVFTIPMFWAFKNLFFSFRFCSSFTDANSNSPNDQESITHNHVGLNTSYNYKVDKLALLRLGQKLTQPQLHH